MKYGKEGMDCPDMDTVLVCEPFSQRNGLQQLLGRTTRERPGKMNPVVLFYEDNIGLVIGMCKKLRGHLSKWAHDEGGPFEYTNLNHPLLRASWKNPQQVFGP
jgi:superfamily II DNA or RNA helicase